MTYKIEEDLIIIIILNRSATKKNSNATSATRVT
jgi:hypothetical protein